MSPVARMIERAAPLFGVTPVDIRSHRRGAAMRARFAVAWAARRATPYSLPQIGRAMGRDHTTVLYAVARAEEMREASSLFRQQSDALAEHAAACLNVVPPHLWETPFVG